MSKVQSPASDAPNSGQEYKWTSFANQYGIADTRHEAIGRAVKHGKWENRKIVAINADSLKRKCEYPIHTGNRYYGDRDILPTTHGTTSIDSESLVRNWNGQAQETIESKWVIDCPVCHVRHESSEKTEEARSALIETVLNCCDIEWCSPTDWLETCPVCGASHREQHGCTAPSYREPSPDLTSPAQCTACDWSIAQAEDIPNHDGSCPECGSPAVHIGEEFNQ